MVTNKNSRQFKDRGVIKIVQRDQLEMALNNIKGNFVREGRMLLICLYFTGARPAEVLKLKAKDIIQHEEWVNIQLDTVKGGNPRTLSFEFKDVLITQLYNYARSIYPDLLLFPNYISSYNVHRVHHSKKDNSITGSSDYIDISKKVNILVHKAFDGVIEDSINAYFLRHSRFSQLIQDGASNEEIMLVKGAKDIRSVHPYVHMSMKTARKIGSMVK